MNSRETLAHVADWLGWQEEQLSYGMKNAFDALRLYDYWMDHQETLPEMADEWDEKDRIAALGYDPMESCNCYESERSGATDAANALRNSYVLIDSVAYVKEEGDSLHILPQISNVLSA